MMAAHPLDILFCVAAGPRLGFGHIVRCRVLADALAVRPLVTVRGTPATRRTALSLGWRLTDRRGWHPGRDLIVIDDPSPAEIRRLCRRARRLGVPYAVISGPAFLDPASAVLAPAITAARDSVRPRNPGQVLITLGGGAAIQTFGPGLAERVRRLVPGAQVRLASGFSQAGRLPRLPAGCKWIRARHGVARALASASVAVVAGGITAFEACALRTPSVGLAVVPAQRRTLRLLARQGALIDASHARADRALDQAAREVARLLAAPTVAARLGRRAGALVDGRGAERVADFLRSRARGTEGRRAA